jgi:hypothetical protein
MTHYALTTPMTSLTDLQPMLTPARMPPTEQFDDVTNGYVCYGQRGRDSRLRPTPNVMSSPAA